MKEMMKLNRLRVVETGPQNAETAKNAREVTSRAHILAQTAAGIVHSSGTAAAGSRISRTVGSAGFSTAAVALAPSEEESEPRGAAVEVSWEGHLKAEWQPLSRKPMM